VLAGPYDVAQAGRMAVIADPHGAALALWQPRDRAGAEVVNEPGALSWNDLLTTDVDAAAAFYRDLLGWEVEQIPGAPYWTIRNRGASNGGMMPMPDEPRAAGAPPAWNVYFAVADLDAALRTVQELGGALVAGPMEVPAGRFAVLRDPQGAVFSLVAGRLDP
jgi:predicted enzyme related to lactoylglutathione lyase